MTGLLVTVPVAPLLRGPTLQSEQVSQLVLGEGAEVLEESGAFLRVRCLFDNYCGWLHSGYATQQPLHEVDRWLATAEWSAGAVLVSEDGASLRAPHRARVLRASTGALALPSGGACTLSVGCIQSRDSLQAAARLDTPAGWAWREFGGTPYLWGGVTSAGADCSGLVQTVFSARGVDLPRDARDQAACGISVPSEQISDGDLLFFRSRDEDQVSHVGIASGTDSMVHSTVRTGGVIRDTWDSGERTASLRSRIVAVRRIA